MSFFSRSSKGKHYKNGNQGSGHYQKKGLFGNLFDMIASRSHSHGNYGNQYNKSSSYNQNAANINASFCSKCNSQIPAGSKFCLQCGEKVNSASLCLSCGEKLPPDAKFCLKCGSKVSK
jgi:ribosomal protein L40E